MLPCFLPPPHEGNTRSSSTLQDTEILVDGKFPFCKTGCGSGTWEDDNVETHTLQDIRTTEIGLVISADS